MEVLTLLLLLACLAAPAASAGPADNPASRNASSCADLTALLSGGQVPGLGPAPCGFLTQWTSQGPPTNATLQGATWDTGFAVSALLLPSGSHVVMQQVVMQRTLLLPVATYPEFAMGVPLQPAIVQVQPNATLSIVSSRIVTACSTLPDILTAAANQGATFTHDTATNSLTVQMYNTTNLLMKDVTIACDDSYNLDAAAAVVYTGDQLQSALAAIDQLNQPGTITLGNHTTLAGKPVATWPPRGYNMSGNLDIYGNVTGTNTVLDLAGVSMFVHLRPGMLVRLHYLQVEGNCIARIPLLTRTKQDFVLMNDIWSVYTGNSSWPRVSKLLEVYDSTLLNAPQELSAVAYWIHLAAPLFPQLLHYAEDALHGLLSTLPAVTITALNATSITYASNQGPSLGQHNVTATIQLPLQLSLPGFSAMTGQDCQPEPQSGRRETYALSDPQLAPDTGLAPLWMISDSEQLLSDMVAAASDITSQIQANRDYVPPMVLIIGALSLPSSVSGQLLLWNRDVMLYGPYIQPPAAVPGNPTTASLDLNGAVNFLRTSDSGTGTLFISHLTLHGLAQQPITSTQQAALPLWFVLMKNRSGAGQVCLTAVTLVLPVSEWKQLYYAAQRGPYWRMGWGAMQPLIQGLTDLTVGQFGASTAGVHLASLVGWGMTASNLYLVPDATVTGSDLPSEMFVAPEGAVSSSDQLSNGGTSGSSGDNHGVIVGASVGGVAGGLALLVAAAVVIRHRHRQQRSKYSADKTSYHDKGQGLAIDSGNLTGPKSDHSSLGSQGNAISSQAAVLYHVEEGVLQNSLNTTSRVEELHTTSVMQTATSMVPIAGISGSSNAQHAIDIKPRSDDLLSMPPIILGAHASQDAAVVVETVDGASNSAHQGTGGRSWASAPNAVTLNGIPQESRAPMSEAAVQELSCGPQALVMKPGSLGSTVGAGTAASGAAAGNSAKIVLERVQRSLTQQSSAAASTQGNHVRADFATVRPEGELGLMPMGRRSSTHARSGSQISTSQMPSSMDSMSSQPRWDPKREVAALAQDMKPDADRLVLLEPIGQGGFGAVYRGRWRGLEVAIKTVLFSEDGGLGAQQRAVTEAAVCTSVMHHNVVATYHYDIMPVGQQAGSTGGMVVEDMTRGGQDPAADWKLFLIQEYCHASLYTVLNSKLMHQQGTPDLDLLLTTLLDVAQGMQYLHSKNILHGDLKPENVLLKNDSTAAIGVVSKITDFGLSSRLDPTATHISNILNGTPFYAAPEVMKHGRLNKASDVYSFGVLMWEMYLATPPWIKTRDGYQANKLFPKFPMHTPAPYVALTLKCLDPRARARPDFNSIVQQLTCMHQAYLDGYDSLIRPSPAAMQALMLAQASSNTGDAATQPTAPPTNAAMPQVYGMQLVPALPGQAAVPLPLGLSPTHPGALVPLVAAGDSQLAQMPALGPEGQLGQFPMGQAPVAQSHMPQAGQRSQPVAARVRSWSEPGAALPMPNFARPFPGSLPPPIDAPAQQQAPLKQQAAALQHFAVSSDAAAAPVVARMDNIMVGGSPVARGRGDVGAKAHLSSCTADPAVIIVAKEDSNNIVTHPSNNMGRGFTPATAAAAAVSPSTKAGGSSRQEQRLGLQAMAQQQAAVIMAAGGVQAITQELGLDLQNSTLHSPNSRRDQTARSQAFTSMLLRAQAAAP